MQKSAGRFFIQELKEKDAGKEKTKRKSLTNQKDLTRKGGGKRGSSNNS